MPILKQETNCYPEDILTRGCLDGARWRVAYTRANREKDLMRRLLAFGVPFYCPVIEKSWRSGQGRLRRSFVPLFANYVFLRASDDQQYQAKTTNCISTFVPVADSAQLQADLSNLDRLITTGEPLTLEEQLVAGQRIRVKSGPFIGCEGTILQRRGARRLLVAIQFLTQGVSVDLSDFEVERL